MPAKLRDAADLAQCLAAADRLMKSGANPANDRSLRETFDTVADGVATRGLIGDEIAQRYLRPMYAELIKRFDYDDARAIYWRFFDAFWPRTWQPWNPRKSARPAQDHPAWYDRHLAQVFEGVTDPIGEPRLKSASTTP